MHNHTHQTIVHLDCMLCWSVLVVVVIIECSMHDYTHQTIVHLDCMLCWSVVVVVVDIIECIMQGAARLITSCLFAGPPTSFSRFPLQFLSSANFYPLKFFILCNFLFSVIFPNHLHLSLFFLCNFSSLYFSWPTYFFF